MNSIRQTLFIWLLSAILAAGALGAIIIYRNTLGEAGQFFDYQLRQVALVLRDQAFESASAQISKEVNDYDFVVQVWSATGALAYQSQPHSSLPTFTTLGFSTVDTAGGQWRTFGVPSRGYVIQVAQPMQVRRTQAAQLALRTLLPFLIVVPVLAVIVLVAVPRTLQPLRRLAAELTARPATALQSIDSSDIPIEVQPTVNAFNDLLGRLATTLEREQEFIADAAHELRTPLTALRLQLESLAAAKDAEERASAERKLAAGVDRAGRLVEQLLSLARLNPHRQAPHRLLQLDDLLRDVVAEKVLIADARRIDLGVTTAQSYSMSGDAVALRALIGNLVDNAIRHSPDGGRVDISLVSDAREGTLKIVDEGPGIEKSEREKVFERFYRGESAASEGSGLGLAIVKSVAEQHRATVELSDGPGGRGLAATVRFLN